MDTTVSQRMRAEWGIRKGLWVEVGGSYVNDLVLLRELYQIYPFCFGSFCPGAKTDLSGSALLKSEQGGSHLGRHLPPVSCGRHGLFTAA